MKFRLRSAHYFPGDNWLPGDTENSDRGESLGTVVGDGTRYPVCAHSDPQTGAMFPTTEMEPLDDEARDALAEEEARLARSHASMNPLEQLPLNMDNFETRYVPGFGLRPAQKGS